VKKVIAVILATIFISASVLGASYLINPAKTERFFVRRILGIKCLDYKQPVYSRKLSSKIPDYIEYSKKAGIKKCEGKEDIEKRVRDGKLVKMNNSKFYIIDDLTHSYPYLTPRAKTLCDLIGKRFQERVSQTRLHGAKFKLTSLTRTAGQLKALRKVNSNTSLNSPHMYGNSFDISYIGFKTGRIFLTNCDEKYLMEELAEVIWELKKEKKCWATFEVQQNCFHVVSK
jgi:hypothetical protein